jgi:O-acetyl-ADP-ribose deacetylase (regulator of RNase III)
MKVIHRSKLRHVEFTLAIGDIFDATVDAVVSSEQTDFVLSENPESVSSRISKRYGARVQRELDAATKGRVLAPGLVIATSGGQDFKRIFHTGFPNDRSDLPDTDRRTTGFGDATREFRETAYFATIGSSITQILDTAVAQQLKSVAVPLIGWGLFGLDEKMLILQFLDAIEEFDDRLAGGEELHVWLVIRDRARDGRNFRCTAPLTSDLRMQACRWVE